MPTITVDVVRGKIGRLKAGGAPGPDSVTKGSLLQYLVIVELLTALYNVALFGGVYLSQWRMHRTTPVSYTHLDVYKRQV